MGFKAAYAVASKIPCTTVANSTSTTVSLFIPMGEILARTRIGADLYDAVHKWVGRLSGGLPWPRFSPVPLLQPSAA